MLEHHPPASHLVGEHALWNTFELMGGHIGSTLPSAGGGEGEGGRHYKCIPPSPFRHRLFPIMQGAYPKHIAPSSAWGGSGQSVLFNVNEVKVRMWTTCAVG